MIDKEIEPINTWKDPDDTCDEVYDRHMDKLAHFDKNIINAVSHLPTCLAVETGDILQKTMLINPQLVREMFCNE